MTIQPQGPRTLRPAQTFGAEISAKRPSRHPAITQASPGNQPKTVTADDNTVARNGCEDLPAFQNSTRPPRQPLARRCPAFW